MAFSDSRGVASTAGWASRSASHSAMCGGGSGHREAQTKCCSLTNMPPPMIATGAGVGVDMVNEAMFVVAEMIRGPTCSDPLGCCSILWFLECDMWSLRLGGGPEGSSGETGRALQK